MAAPAWFNASVYFQNKLASLGTEWNDLTLRKAFTDAGYNVENDFSGALYQHFEDYGNAENVSPSGYFDAAQYMSAKAARFYNTDTPTAAQIKAMYDSFALNNLTAWDHYTQYGWVVTDTNENVNPSNSFNNQKYMEDKLAQMKGSNPDYTMDDLVKAFQASGLSPIEHYFMYGKDEGLTVSAPTTYTGERFNLTTQPDDYTGTNGNDYIVARPGTLGDLDTIDGGAGNDTLYAYLDANNVASTPWISNVENIWVRGQGHQNTDDGDNNISTNAGWNVSLDLGDTTGMTKLVNDNSRSDIAIEDVRTDSNKMTIGFYDTDPGNVDFGVFFNSQNIKEYGGGSTGTLSLQLMDVKNAQTNDQYLTEQPFNKFTFYYTADGGSKETIQLVFRSADEALYKGATADYDSLVQAFNNALDDFIAANPQYAGIFEIKTGGKFPGTAGTDTIWTDPDGVLIVITAQGGAVDAPDTDINVGWGVTTGNVPSTGGIAWGVDKGVSIECPLYQTNIELDNVGRVQWNDVKPNCLPSNDDFGSQAGDMVVGGMGERDGIQRFDVSVDRGSWLSSLASTNNQLRMVTFVNADVNGDGYYNRPEQAYPNQNVADPTKDYGQIYIGDSQAGGSGDMYAWQDAPKLLSTTGLKDVKLVDGSAFEGQMNIGAQITADSYGKYFNEVDGYRSVYDSFAPDGEFKYDLGKNDDVLNMTVNGGIATDQDFQLIINGNGGNDFINFAFTDLSANQRSNIINGTVNDGHERVIINGGDGNDTIKFWGDGSVTVNGGAGNDAIYVGQTPAQNGVVLFNVGLVGAPATDAERGIEMGRDGAQPLDNDILGIGVSDFALATGAGVAVAAANAGLRVTVSFKGHSTTMNIDTSKVQGNVVTAEFLNEAVAKAIADDKYLSNLIVAKDGAGHSLMIESLVDGLVEADDIVINFTSTLAAANAPVMTAIGNAYNHDDTKGMGMLNGTTAADGTNGGTGLVGDVYNTTSHNVVDAGTGDDTIVLNANSAQGTATVPLNDIVVLSGVNGFGYDHVVNFDYASGAAAIDQFDVSAYAGTTAALTVNSLAATAAGLTGTNTLLTVAQGVSAANALGSWDGAANKGVLAVQIANTNTWQFFSVNNADANGDIIASEVAILGTMTFDTDTAADIVTAIGAGLADANEGFFV